jgi:hypothetical protein
MAEMTGLVRVFWLVYMNNSPTTVTDPVTYNNRLLQCAIVRRTVQFSTGATDPTAAKQRQSYGVNYT